MVDVRPAMVDVRPAMVDALRYAGRAQRLRRERACASIVLLLCLDYFETAEQYHYLGRHTQTKTFRNPGLRSVVLALPT